MSINQQNKEEEVDLGSLFVIIGNGFKKFFSVYWENLHWDISLLHPNSPFY